MPRASRPGSTLEDRVKPFVVTQIAGGLAVQCPRSDCGVTHSVNEDAWREGRGPAIGTQTRACCYCFRVARIP